MRKNDPIVQLNYLNEIGKGACGAERNPCPLIVTLNRRAAADPFQKAIRDDQKKLEGSYDKMRN